MSMLDTQWEALRKQLDAAPWLKWALALVAVLLAMFVWQGLEKLRLQAQDAAIDEEVKLHRIRGLQGQDVWMEREKQAAELHQGLLAEIPVVATSGLAQATLQSWLRDLANVASDDPNLRITVDNAAPLERLPGLLRVHASLSGNLSPRQALNILRRIESATNLVVIETLDIRSDSSKTASIGMNAYYRLPETNPAAARDTEAQ